MELEGRRILTDPVLRRQVGPLWRHPPRPPVEALSRLDAILISHLHLDHYDPPSLRMLDKDTPVVGPAGSARSLRRRLGFAKVHELEPGERLELNGIEVLATEARHRGTRHPLAFETPSLGYIVDRSRAIYFAGDTALFHGMSDLWDGDLDVALLPIAGLGPRLPEGEHMGPHSAVKAMRLLRPRLTVPIHWGTYRMPGTVLLRMRPDIHTRAPFTFMREAAALAPEHRAVLLEPGERLELDTIARTW